MAASAFLAVVTILAALAIAAYPPYEAPSHDSPYFRLVANVTCDDFTPSVQGWGLTSLPIDAETSLAVSTPQVINDGL